MLCTDAGLRKAASTEGPLTTLYLTFNISPPHRKLNWLFLALPAPRINDGHLNLFIQGNFCCGPYPHAPCSPTPSLSLALGAVPSLPIPPCEGTFKLHRMSQPRPRQPSAQPPTPYLLGGAPSYQLPQSACGPPQPTDLTPLFNQVPSTLFPILHLCLPCFSTILHAHSFIGNCVFVFHDAPMRFSINQSP